MNESKLKLKTKLDNSEKKYITIKDVQYLHKIMRRYFQQRISDELDDENVVVVYRAYREDSFCIIINNIDDIAVEGKVRLYKKPANKYIKKYEYVSEILNNPTWLTIAIKANDMIKKTDSFLENHLDGIELIGSSKVYFIMNS